ncbi:hydrolase, partial [Dietzia kunjamensis]|nr:hydrolase [Dietzia kunjamensis]
MGAHSIKTSSTGRRVAAAAGLLAAGAAVAGSGTAAAAPVTVDVPVE